uniref:Integrase, catalytic region, zinc finger, CCHC-type, peptidase aspartic, catalytic n=1 Tax=Tanacetum cinerariifolium TaxID=118510 RepID=A0A699GWI9_TANCI|nr:integrase, catalytic region, zinc finger, CCHC-type, peptidase aspartic, catalytic [Tanacetum cinerariifolium]
MDIESAQNNAVANLPLLKQGDYEMWKLRIEQYFQIQDYALWDVIENVNSFNPVPRITSNIDGTYTSTISGPVTTKEKAQKNNDVKAGSMLLIALPNEHLLKITQYKNAKTLFEAIQASNNEVDTTSIQVSDASTPVSTVSSLDNTANLNDATVRNGFEMTVSFAEYESKKVLSENWLRDDDLVYWLILKGEEEAGIRMMMPTAGMYEKTSPRSCLRWKPAGRIFNTVKLSSNIMPNPPSPTPYLPPTKKDWDTLFQPIFDEYFNPLPSVVSPVPTAAALRLVDPTDTPSSTTTNQDVLSISTSQNLKEIQSLVIPSGVEEYFHDIEVAHLDNDPFFVVLIPEPNSKESSLRDVIPTNVHSVNQPQEHLKKWTKDHPLDNVIGSPSRLVSTRHQLQNESMFYYFDAFLTSVEPKNYKEALKESCWIEAMQEELNKFELLEV